MAATGDLRWRQRFEHLERAFSRFRAACVQATYSELEFGRLVGWIDFRGRDMDDGT